MRSRFLTCLFTAVVLAAMSFSLAFAQDPMAVPKKEFKAEGENFGYIPPPIDLNYLQPEANLLGAPLTSWDWRAMGGVTPVKNQNPYGTCWAFAACGDLESKVLINESFTADYSELNIQACNLTSYHDCNIGGNAWIANNYLSQFGSVQESCDPYPGGCPNPTCINPACAFFKQIREWILIPNDVTAIKNAVQTYGPVYTSMYASFSGFGSYDGSYCITYSGTEDPNHAVLIVGWDDDMCSGNGAWIVKNSWGTGWGDNGYFYIQYGSARIGSSSSVISGYVDYDSNETIHYYDEWGWWSSVGWGDGVDWGMMELTHNQSDEYLKAVSFSGTNSPTSYEIYVYDSFSGGSLSNLLVGPISGTVSEAGYYTVDLPAPLLLVSGDPVYIAIEFDTGTYGYPIPYDDTGAMETDKSFVSNDGSTFTALDNGSYAMGDVSIRGIVGPESSSGNCSKEGIPQIQTGFPTGTQTAVKGEEWCATITLGNSGASTDTFCVDVYDTKGWNITSDPAAFSCRELAAGGTWNQQICVVPPCAAASGELDTLYAVMAYCDLDGICSPDCDGNDTTMVVLSAADPGEDITIEQADRYYVEIGITEASVPFQLCNPNPCASPTVYNYQITSPGYSSGGCVIPSIDQSGSTGSVGGGDCEAVYASLDASEACVGDTASLQIVAWTGSVSDTCVQIVEIIEPIPVPVFSPVILVVMVLGLILVAAIVFKRRAEGNA